ncbi:hypothetical protein T492DRAFT_195653, partial [Pavlovales sp. CCMP2436]
MPGLGLALPLRPVKGQQIEGNRPLSASSVRIDRSVAPAPEHFDVHGVCAQEATRREQLRDFQSELLGRMKRLEHSNREEQRERAAQLASVQDVERRRARQLAANASADLVKALHMDGYASPARSALAQLAAGAHEAPSRPASKLHAQAQQILVAVRAARAGLRSRAAAAHGGGGLDGAADDGEDDIIYKPPVEQAEFDGHTPVDFDLPVERPRAPHAAAQTESARVRARARMQQVAEAGPGASDSFVSSRAGVGSSTSQWGRSREAIVVFEVYPPPLPPHMAVDMRSLCKIT